VTQPRLLLVDDEELFVRGLSRELSRLGWQVQTADNTESALRALRQNEFDALVLDQKLPGSNGVDLLGELGRVLARPVAVLLSGYLSVATTVRAIQAGASDVLEKPVSASELDSRLRRLLEAREGARSGMTSAGMNSELRKVLGETAGMRAAREQMQTATRYPELCLTIVGESGTGKEQVADLRRALKLREIARRHRRRDAGHRLRLPGRPRSIDKVLQVFVEELVQQSTGGEQSREVVERYVVAGARCERIAAGDRLLAQRSRSTRRTEGLLHLLQRALRLLLDLDLDDVALARMAQSVETDFVGAPVGIMDPMASSLGRDGEALFLDTRSLAVERVPLPPSIEIVVIHSGVTHAHAGGEYVTRRRESFEAAQRLGISLRTVEMHRGNMMERLEVASLAEALKLALEAGLEPPPDPDL